MLNLLKPIFITTLILCSNLCMASENVKTVLSKLNLKNYSDTLGNQIVAKLDEGLKEIAKQSSWNKETLMSLFEEMNPTLKSVYNVNTESLEELERNITLLNNTKILPSSTFTPPIRIVDAKTGSYALDNERKDQYMYNALYLIFMGKTMKHYYALEHNFYLEEYDSFQKLMDSLLDEVGIFSNRIELLWLSEISNQFHINQEWFPEMLEDL